MKLLFDIETDGLDATVVWCLVIQDVDTNQVWEYSPNEIEDGVKIMLKDIQRWKTAPLWTVNSIEKATKSWFSYMKNINK